MKLVEMVRQLQQFLDSFLDYLSALALEHKLHQADVPDHVRKLARTRALSALRLLDGRRKSQLLQFLYESGLVDSKPVIQLTGADLSDSILDEATLRQAEIRGAYLNNSSIRRAYLTGADLRGSDFSCADFSGSDLTDAKLAQANLDRCQFEQAVFANTDVSGANLDRDKLTNEQRKGLIEG
ncbi:MAG: pentapeptide repeat-containing protein [Woeseiaceae bacterium]|nr:pentapeptide repeat-containing protein [Woeseiaceae bacterium]